MKTPRIVKAVEHIDDDLINDALKSEKSLKKNIWIKRTSLAACFALILFAAALAGPRLSGNKIIAPSVDSGNITSAVDNSNTNVSLNTEEASAEVNTEKSDFSVKSEETNPPAVTEETVPALNDETTGSVIIENFGYTERYFYRVNDGAFSTYISGKVIDADKVGEKIADVSVTAGWETWGGGNLLKTVSTETIRAEVYSIDRISNDTAVALKFIDKGEAVTTTHYYVIMNPDADLSAVKDYIIPYSVPDYTRYKTNGEETAINENTGEEIVIVCTTRLIVE